MKRSLTRQLLIVIGVPLVAIIVLIGILGYRAATGEINEVYDSQLVLSAQSLLRAANAQSGPAPGAGLATDTGLDADQRDGVDEYTQWHSFRVWRGDVIVLASANAPSGPPHPPGLATDHIGGDAWRVFTLHQGVYTVETRENTRARGEEISDITLGLVGPLLLLLPVIGAILWFGVRRGLRDLRAFAGTVASRSPDDLARIDNDVPVELAPVADAVNGLFGKLERSLDQERAFTDNAAHELRTPLATIKAQAEVIAGARNAAERDTAMAELGLGISRATRLMEQLLTLARLRQGPPQTSQVRLMDPVAEAIKDVYTALAAKSIDVQVTGDDAVAADTDPALLYLMLRNLLENAGKYSPPGSAVEVEVARNEIVIRDHGPGIAEAERDKVFTRFYRIKGTRESGSGLGLSIVRSVAQRLGCAVSLETPEDSEGLRVRIALSD